MTESETLFLARVRAFAADRPDMIGHIVQAAQAGLEDKLKRLQQCRADMETVAVMALDARLYKQNRRHMAELLNRWNDSALSLNWSDRIEELMK